jgi:hypothetical protein
VASAKPFISLRTRFWIFAAVFLLGFIAIGPQLPSDYEGAFFVAWFLVFAIGQFFVFRCPHCHRSAIFGPYKRYRPFIGSHCPHCGKTY